MKSYIPVKVSFNVSGSKKLYGAGSNGDFRACIEAEPKEADLKSPCDWNGDRRNSFY